MWTKRVRSDFCTATAEGVEISEAMKEKRCTRQFALTVEKNAKYHSNPMVADQYTAQSVTEESTPTKKSILDNIT